MAVEGGLLHWEAKLRAQWEQEERNERLEDQSASMMMKPTREDGEEKFLRVDS